MNPRERSLLKSLDKLFAKATSREWSAAFRAAGIEYGGPGFTKFKGQLHKAVTKPKQATKANAEAAKTPKKESTRKVLLTFDALDDPSFTRSPNSEYSRWLNIIGNVHENASSLLSRNPLDKDATRDSRLAKRK